MKITLRVSYVDEDNQEFGLEEKVTDPSKIKETINFIIEVLERDYHARHPGEDARWA